jgi:outer membrane protein assembly factor BamE (lipoprotein component of BamABCDE complex)
MDGRLRAAARGAGLGLLALLVGCSLMPERLPMGATRGEIENRLGSPTAVHALADGTRLQYSRQPAGQQVYNLDLDAAGRLRQTEQVMDAGWLQRIPVDQWTRQDALLQLGKPAIVERVASFDGVLWTYRFREMNIPRFVHLYLDTAGVVQRVGFSDEPLPDDVFDMAH